MPQQLEKGDQIEFEYRADKYEPGVYRGHVVGLGPRRVVVLSNGNKAYLSDPEQIIRIVRKNRPDEIHTMAEEFRFKYGLGQDPVRAI